MSVSGSNDRRAGVYIVRGKGVHDVISEGGIHTLIVDLPDRGLEAITSITLSLQVHRVH